MNLSNDFDKFIKSKKINSSYYNRYKRISSDFMDESFLPIPQTSDVFHKLLKDRIIILAGEVDDMLCETIKAHLIYLESLSKEDIKIYINSPGGDVYSGLGLLDTMEYIKPEIVTINTGLAASMASVILCSGTKGKRKSLKRARTLIHQPLSYIGFAQASDIEIDAKQVNSLKKELYDIISERTGQPYKKVHEDADRDYWLNAKEALDYGIIDEIIKSKKK
jgi:ATP-dependent Clp protease protease subunit